MGIFSFLYLLLSIISFADAGGWIGVNYGRLGNDLPLPAKVVELLKNNAILRIKIFDTDAAVLTALAKTGISVIVCLPNQLLSAAAGSQSFTDQWVQANIKKFYPATEIDTIAAGNEVFVDPTNLTQFLVPAMKNLHASLQKYNLTGIKVSSPIAFSALASSYPTSSGSFKPELVESVMKPMLDFFRRTNSFLMFNIYPFFAYSANSDKISLNYTLFQDNPGVVDSGNGLKYFSLFEAQVDAVYAAMSALKYGDIKLVITESGWPSNGDDNELGASVENAALYNGNLLRRVMMGDGTPLQPERPLNVFLFALFNENKKPGPTSERNFGLFYPNQQRVYDIPLNYDQLLKKGQLVTWTPGASGLPSSKGQTWCVAKANIRGNKLQAGLEYACGDGGADCGPIQPGSTCYEPNTLEAHASYAFNSYYQKNGRAPGSCDFDGTAYVVDKPPQYGECEFPTTPISGTTPSSGTPPNGGTPPSQGDQPSNGTPPASGPPATGTPPANGMPPDSETPSVEGQLWCVAKGNADPQKLTSGMEYACGEGGADCGPIQPGGTCYEPNVLVAHASYAFNNYYQKKAHAPGSCDFGGTASVVNQVPQFGKCILSSRTGGTWHSNGTLPNTGTPLPKDQTWCVANEKAGVDILTAWLKFGCWKGWADCTLIQPGSSCYNDNSLVAQMSYVFNGYYQKKARAAGSCDFAGAAYMTSQRPQYGDCEFTTESGSSPAPASGAWFSQGRTWCLASKSAGDEILLAWIKYACDGGLADCKPIQEDGFCYDNNSTITHASYTLNGYYESKGHAPGTCDFGGAAYIITQPPQYGECQFTPGVLPSNGTTWCVAKKNPEGADEWKIQKGLKYACGEGKADCAPIQPGGTCYNPNTLEAHASYAFNSYYQMRARDASACDFNGVGQIVNEAPQYGKCEFPTYYTTGS